MEKRLYRSSTDYVFGGVAGGLGSYFNIDPTFVRLGFVLFTFAGGAGPLIYLVLMVILPKETENRAEVAETVEEVENSNEEKARPASRNTLALILIGVGLVALLNQVAPLVWLSWDILWPVLLVGFGLYLIFKRR